MTPDQETLLGQQMLAHERKDRHRGVLPKSPQISQKPRGPLSIVAHAILTETPQTSAQLAEQFAAAGLRRMTVSEVARAMPSVVQNSTELASVCIDGRSVWFRKAPACEAHVPLSSRLAMAKAEAGV